MSMGQHILNKMLIEGADISPEKRQEVISEVDEAMRDNHFFVIKKDGRDIGFFTYFELDKIFINNCVIYKKFRNYTNLLSLRKLFRDKYKGKQLYWKNKKRNERLCLVK